MIKSKTIRVSIWLKIRNIFFFLFMFSFVLIALQNGRFGIATIFLILTLFFLWIALRTFATLTVDEYKVQINEPHVTFEINWDDVDFIDQSGPITKLYSQEHALGYTLSPAENDHLEFVEFVNKMVEKNKIKLGHPEGMTDDIYEEHLKASKIGRGFFVGYFLN